MSATFLLRNFLNPRHAPRYWSSTASLTNLNINNETKVATLTLQRPPANALSLELMQQIKRDLDTVKTQQGLQGLILTSASDRIFSAGLDLTEVYQSEPKRFAIFWKALQDLWYGLFALHLPTVAIINGHAVAGGCMMATCCDYRVMLPNFQIGLNESRAGIAAPKYVVDAYMNVMPIRRTAEADLIVGRVYSSEEALKAGLIDALVPSKQAALEKSLQFFDTYKGVNVEAAAQTKLNCRRNVLQDFERDRKNDLEVAMQTLLGEEVQKHLGEYLKTFGKSRGKKKE